MKAWLQRHPRIRDVVKNILGSRVEVIGLDYGIVMATRMAYIIPSDIDCIIGIPRSGLLFANIIANLRGLPLSTPEDFSKDIVWRSKLKFSKPITSVLLVDDMATTGEQIDSAVELLHSFKPELKITVACLLVTPEASSKVDRYSKMLDERHSYFTEWNFFHSAFKDWGPICTDLDGVLCLDAADEVPNIIPNFTIKAIITSRPESRRGETENWLRRHNVSYEQLIMGGDKTSNSFIHSVELKSSALLSLTPIPAMFWESSVDQAKAIASLSRIPVFCTDDRRLYRA